MVIAGLAWRPVHAQNTYPKAELFGGFSLLSVGDVDNKREQFPGWQAGVAGNVHRSIGFVADFGGNYKTVQGVKINAYEYLFGPRFNLRADKVTAFGEVLFGGVHTSAGGETQNGFLMGVGGGLDVNAGKKAAIRIVHMDWTPNRFNGDWSKKEFRISFGIVYKIGG